MCYNFACRLRHLLEVHVLIMEYPGYGICPGKPSEDSFRQASQICLNFVTKVLRIPSSDIIIVGRSLGAAVALQVAATSAACGLVLIAPFLSLQDAVGQFVGQEASKVLVKNMFCNSEVIKTVKEVPVLVIHGDRDMLVDCSQGRQLLELCPSETKRFVSPPGMGHNDDLLANVDLLWRPMMEFFALPDYDFRQLRLPKEAFDKRLCPLYHGVVEMTKHDRPLPASTGDEAQEVWGSDVPRPAEGLSPCRGPKVCDDRCKHVVGDLQPPEADCDELLRHSQEDSAGAEPDLNVGITRYLAFADSSGFSAKVASTSGSGGSSQVPTVPMGSGREISEMSCSKPVAAG
ncbi:abhd13 [Symbiodinium sp. KB8]|nr:abhd13 [Symbiodinium sp. KB8]